MFKFLKEKLKSAVSQLSEEIEEKGETQTSDPDDQRESDATQKSESTPKEVVEAPKEEEKAVEERPEEPVEEKKSFFAKIKDKFKKEEDIEAVPEEELEEIPIEKLEEEAKEEKEEAAVIEKEKQAEEKVKEKLEKKEIPSVQELSEREPKGFLGKIKEKIVTKKINEKQFNDLFWNLEIILLENNIAVEVIEKIKEDLKEILVDKPIPRTGIEKTITKSLKQTLGGLFDVEKIDILEKAKEKKPLVICFVGINGSGKTTTIAKVAKLFQNNGKSVVLAAADTFRAAAIDQLQKHADNLKLRLIKHDYGSDAAAVAFDAVKHAQAKGIDVVLIDTAGRMHSNVNLMEEMEKIIRVANPDLKIFVGESITGNDCTEQAKKFNESIGLDGIILSKADIDEKGGAAISISHVTGKPILFIGTGQEYEDLKEFDSQVILDSLDL
ncbi:signal recognition particle-docking protein FtsY [Candidatus Woesearchaeota archaeon]|nr:signal recognition particle-docking protein FtsY [Candidatus Woesearchaeota archaeon]